MMQATGLAPVPCVLLWNWTVTVFVMRASNWNP